MIFEKVIPFWKNEPLISFFVLVPVLEPSLLETWGRNCGIASCMAFCHGWGRFIKGMPHPIRLAVEGLGGERTYQAISFSNSTKKKKMASKWTFPRALASPAWISLTSADPVLTAFKLSWELEKLSIKENEFKDVYVQLSRQCKDFACDLLSQCRNTEEVIAVLNKDSADQDSLIMEDLSGSKLSLARLKLAIKYEQKQVSKGTGPNSNDVFAETLYMKTPFSLAFS